MEMAELLTKIDEALKLKGFERRAAVRYAAAISQSVPTPDGVNTEDHPLLKSELNDIADALINVSQAI